MKNFSENPQGTVEPIVFDTIFAEKSNGGMVQFPEVDFPKGTPVGTDAEGMLYANKVYKLVKAVGASDTEIEIKKGSGVAVGDFIAFGTKSVAATAVDTSHQDKDVVTVTMGVAIALRHNPELYAAGSVSASSAAPKYNIQYLTGDRLIGGAGAQLIKLVNGANVRKETVNCPDEILAKLKTINKV